MLCGLLCVRCAGGGGGGVYVGEEDPTNSLPSSPDLSVGATVSALDSAFTNCSAAAGGAMLFGTLKGLGVSNVEASGCRAQMQGGTLAVIQSTRPLMFSQGAFRLNGLTFRDSASAGAGGSMVLLSVSTSVSILQSTITKSRAQLGGSLYIQGGQLNSVQSVTFDQSFASAEGGAVYIRSTQRVGFIDCTFTSNTATYLGGSVQAKFSNLDLEGQSRAHAQPGDSPQQADRADSNPRPQFLLSHHGHVFAPSLLCAGVTFTDCGLVEAVVPLPGQTRSGGAIHFVGGILALTHVAFTNCYAIPPTTHLASCAASHDEASGFSPNGSGAAIAMQLSGLTSSNVTVSQGRACSGGFLSVDGAGAEDLVDLLHTRVTGMEAWSGAVLAIRGASLVSVVELFVSDSVARSNGGAIVFSATAQVSLAASTFANVSCTPLTSGGSCDGGALWMTSPRQFASLTTGTSFADVRAEGAGAVSFQSVSSVTADALATILPFEDLSSPDAGNSFIQTASLPPFFQYGPIRASSVVNLTTLIPSLQIYPGQLLDASLPSVAIVTVDAFGQACTMDRSLVVAIEAIGAGSESVSFVGTVLQKVQAETGAANFSSGDLRINAPPGDYTLRFSVISLPDLTVDVALTAIDSCPAGLFYSVGLRSCISCPSDLVVFNATLNGCEQCLAGWQRSAPSVANATGGPLNDGVFCEVCPLGSVSTSGSRCAPCPPNTYQPTPFSACVQCSDLAGLQCGGDGLASVESGYFALSVPDGRGGSLIETFQCPDGFCSAAKVQRAVAEAAVTEGLGVAPASASSAINAYDQCAFPRLASPSNLLCGECVEGYRPWGNRCSRCDSVDGGMLFGLIVLSLVLLAWLIRSALGSPSAGHAVVVLYFVQTVILEVGSLNSLLAWLNVVLLSPNSVGRCVAPLSPYQQTQAQILMPVALWVELCIIALVHFLAFKRWGALASREASVNSSASLAVCVRASAVQFISRFSLDLYVSASLSLLLFSYTQVAVACVTYLRCVDVGGVTVVFSQPAMRCESEEYAKTKVLVVIALVTYIAGLPVGIAAFLWRRSDAIREAHSALAAQQQEDRARITSAPVSSESSDGEVNAFTSVAPVSASSPSSAPSAFTLASASSSRFLLRYAPLFAMYSSSAWFWQVIVLIRRTAFVVISVTLLPTPRRRFVAFALSTLFSLLLQLFVEPFRVGAFNRAEAASHSLLIMMSISLGLEDPPFSNGINAFIFLLVIPPLCLYALWAAGSKLIGAKLDRDRVYAAKEREQLELEANSDAGLTRNPSIAHPRAAAAFGVEMLSSSVPSDTACSSAQAQL